MVTYGLYQQVLDRKRTIQAALEKELPQLKRRILKFDYDQEQLRLQQQRELEEKQRYEQEEAKLAAATAAEAVGMDEQSIETILTAPDTMRLQWQCQPSSTPRESAGARVGPPKSPICGAGESRGQGQETSSVARSQHAGAERPGASLKTAMQIPGVRAVDKGSIAVRG